jgi:hypothetical protein
MRQSGPGRLGFIHEHKALEYYRRGIDQWYLMWGNAAFTYYAHPAVRAAAKISPAMTAVVANIVGAQPRIRIYATPENRAIVHKIFALRRQLQWVLGSIVGLTVILAIQLVLASSWRTS